MFLFSQINQRHYDYFHDQFQLFLNENPCSNRSKFLADDKISQSVKDGEQEYLRKCRAIK